MNGNIDGMGRVTYEHNGECFFLPFGLDDVSDSSLKLKPGDKVSFVMATDKRCVRVVTPKITIVNRYPKITIVHRYPKITIVHRYPLDFKCFSCIFDGLVSYWEEVRGVSHYLMYSVL